MAVIDAHAHIYPNKIASRAVDAVGDFYLIDMFGEGTVEHLLSAQQHAPITHFIVHSVATTPGSVESINNFIAEQCRQHPEFIGFMAMHQDYPEPEKEIERAIGLGLKGMKLHPDTQHVNMDDPRLMNVYEMIEGRLPIVIHTGDYRYDYSHPRRLMNVLKTFPDLVVDAAHSVAGRAMKWATTSCITPTTCSWTRRAPSSSWGSAARWSWRACGAPTASCSARTTPCGALRRNTTSSSPPASRRTSWRTCCGTTPSVSPA